MRTLLSALSTTPRAIFLHVLARGYAVTDIEGVHFDDVAWFTTLGEACGSFFGEPLDCTGVAFADAHKWSPGLRAAEWWPVENRGHYARNVVPDAGPWLRPFAAIPA